MDTHIFSFNICRLCLWNSGNLLPIFTGAGAEQRFAWKIRDLFPFSVELNDSLPKNICQHCIYKLEMLHDFYSACVASDKKLRGYILKQHPGSARARTPAPTPIPEVIIDDDDDEVELEEEHHSVKVEAPETNPDPIAMHDTEDAGYSFNSTPVHNASADKSPSGPSLDDSDVTPSQVLFLEENNTSLFEDEGGRHDTLTNGSTANTPGSSCIAVPSSSTGDEYQRADTPERRTSPTTESIYFCSRCTQSFESKVLLTLHFCNPKRFECCSYCSKTYCDKKLLLAHEKLHNGGVLLFHCRACGKEFHTDKDCKIHVNTMCPRVGVRNDHQYASLSAATNNIPPFPCGICKKHFKTAATLAKHNKTKEHKLKVKLSKDASSDTESRKSQPGNDSETEDTLDKSKRVRRSPYPDSSCIVEPQKRKYTFEPIE